MIIKYNNKIVTKSHKWCSNTGATPIPPGPEPTDEVTIGTQTWMTKNLAIDDGEGGIYKRTVNYGQGDVVEYYYTFAAANRVANTVDGWHLPSRDEWYTLMNNVNVNLFKSTYGWYNDSNGNDYYGFSAFPAGSESGYNFGKRATFWTSTPRTNSIQAWEIGIVYSSISFQPGTSGPNYGNSVRLIKDN